MYLKKSKFWQVKFLYRFEVLCGGGDKIQDWKIEFTNKLFAVPCTDWAVRISLAINELQGMISIPFIYRRTVDRIRFIDVYWLAEIYGWLRSGETFS